MAKGRPQVTSSGLGQQALFIREEKQDVEVVGTSQDGAVVSKRTEGEGQQGLEKSCAYQQAFLVVF